MTARVTRPSAAHTFSAVKRDQRLVWSVPRLWELAKDLPVREISLQEFASYLDNDFWFNSGVAPTTRSVAAHCRKIIDAKLSFPILLDQEGRLMDGMHRLAKAWLMGRTSVRAVQFTTTPPPDTVEDL
jgi:hypothetical protein